MTDIPASGFHFVQWSDASTTNPRTDTNVSGNITVTALNAANVIVPVTLTSIAVTTPATKIAYTVGDTLDITGLVVTGTYSNASTQPQTITSTNILGFNSSVATSSQRLTISVGSTTTTYIISIVAAPIIVAPVVTPPVVSSGGGGVIVGLLGVVNGAVAPSQSGNAQAQSIQPQSQGQVLGASTYNFTRILSFGAKDGGLVNKAYLVD